MLSAGPDNAALPTPGNVIAEKRAAFDVGIPLATEKSFFRGQRELVELGGGLRWSP